MKKEGFHAATFDRAHFVKTLKRSSCLLSGQFIATNFKFSGSSVHVMMNNKEVGKLNEFVPLHNYDHHEIDVRFYAPYLLNGLQTFQENVSFFLHSATKPIMFETSTEKMQKLYLVMPVSAAQQAQG